MEPPLKASLIRLSACSALVAASVCSHADTLYQLPGATPAQVSPDSLSASFVSGTGVGNISLQLQGYGTLDGDNFWIDILSVTLNGTLLFSGTWDLGGGGTDRTLIDILGATVSHNVANQTVDVSLPINFSAGSNTLVVAYDSPSAFEGTARAGSQGLGDEGWGLNSLSAVGPVPEPAGPWLLLAGLGGIAALHRRGRALAR